MNVVCRLAQRIVVRQSYRSSAALETAIKRQQDIDDRIALLEQQANLAVVLHQVTEERNGPTQGVE